MKNKLERFLREYRMVSPGDTVICALSGGADSVAMAFAFYLLKDKLDIHLEAAHFNHHLRGEESQRDEQFVRDFCHQFDIPLTVGSGHPAPRDWKQLPEKQDMLSSGHCPERLPRLTQRMTMRRRC